MREKRGRKDSRLGGKLGGRKGRHRNRSKKGKKKEKRDRNKETREEENLRPEIRHNGLTKGGNSNERGGRFRSRERNQEVDVLKECKNRMSYITKT